MMGSFAGSLYGALFAGARAIVRAGRAIGFDVRPTFARAEPFFLRLSARLAGKSISLDGYSMCLGDALGDRYERIGYCFGYEKRTTELFRQCLRPGDTVIDIGAHIGYYTLLAARLVGPSGHAYAFEPELRNRELLVQNLALNGFKHVTVLEQAVSARSGSAELNLDSETGWHSLYLAPHKVGSTRVETVSLDDLFPEAPSRLALIKMDVQGGEGHVIEGAQRLLRLAKNCKMIIEWWPEGLRAAGSDPEHLFCCLRDLGFRLSLVLENETDLLPLSDYEQLQRGIQSRGHTLNVFCER